MKPRDAALVKQAVATIITPGMGAEAVRCAKSALASLGVDEYLAVAQAREAAKPVHGPLRKDGAAGALVVRAPLDSGHTLVLECSPAEVAGLVNGAYDALHGRSL